MGIDNTNITITKKFSAFGKTFQPKATSYMVIASVLFFLASCSNNKNKFDASGSFEAEETVISSEVTGTILQFDLEEGQTIREGQFIGYIDSMQFSLKKKQLEAQLRATGKRLPNISAQTGYFDNQEAVVQSKLKNLLHEQTRTKNLLKADAATPKQLDDINAKIDEIQKELLLIGKQKNAQVSVLETQSSSISGDLLPLEVQIEQLNDQLKKCRLISSQNGTVLIKYAEANEMASPGKPLYKIADLSTIILRAYITGNQLPLVKLNQQVRIFTDDGKGAYKESKGIITWINDKAEFTPKTIQTKDERANLVYAVKVKVVNDGSYKIGMYGEIKF
ncbi:MAG: HlyD family efflux transporter periplasmic adaptor subunit [Ferruginibacter sp.]